MARKQAKKEGNLPTHPIVEAGKHTRFKPGDPRIRPGPGRPPNWWKGLLATYEADAVEPTRRNLPRER